MLVGGAVDELLHDIGAGAITLAEGVGILLEGDLCIAMAQTRGDRHHVDIVTEQDGGVGMAQLVEAEACEAVAIREAAPLLAGRIVVHGATVPVADDTVYAAPSIAEDVLAVVLVCLGLLQQQQHTVREIHDAVGAIRLGVAGYASRFRRVADGLGDVDAAAREVDIRIALIRRDLRVSVGITSRSLRDLPRVEYQVYLDRVAMWDEYEAIMEVIRDGDQP